MTTMPTAFKVGTINYRITNDPNEWAKYEYGVGRKDDFGHCDNDAATIYINPGSALGVARQTLWHDDEARRHAYFCPTFRIARDIFDTEALSWQVSA